MVFFQPPAGFVPNFQWLFPMVYHGFFPWFTLVSHHVPKKKHQGKSASPHPVVSGLPIEDSGEGEGERPIVVFPGIAGIPSGND